MVCGHLDRNLLARAVTELLAGDLANLVTSTDPVPAPGPRCACDEHPPAPRPTIPGALPATGMPRPAATAPGQPPATGPVPPGLAGGPADPGAAAGSALTPGGLARLQDTLLRYAVSLLSGPAGLAAYLRTQLTGGFFPSPSLPLDLGEPTEQVPATSAPGGDHAGPALLVPRLHRAARALSCASCDPPVAGRPDAAGQPDPAVPVSSSDRGAPLGLDAATPRRRHHHRHQPRRPKDLAQPQPPTRPRPSLGRPASTRPARHRRVGH